MDSEEEPPECDEEEGSKEDSESGVANLSLATSIASKYIFNIEEYYYVNNTNDWDGEFAPAYCFMAKGAKVPKHTSSSNSSDSEPYDYHKPSYYKLANVDTKQKNVLAKLQKLLDKSDDLLNEETDQTPILTGDIQSLHSKFDGFQERHYTLFAGQENLMNFLKESKILRN
ncbi:hypothetical protein ZWY2020_037086 [Hordeum vulgare]|nr:hypothetical protein ZWY2020_037086 [Hordeum vulgare]